MNTPDTARWFFPSVLIIVLWTVACHVAGALAFPEMMWGAHHYAFLSTAALVIASIALVLLCAWAIRMQRSSASRWPAPRISLGSPFVITIALTMTAALMWLSRSASLYLGDGNVLINSMADGQTFHPREPLTMSLQQLAYQVVRLLGWGTSPTHAARIAVALNSIFAGVLFVAVAVWLGREIMRLRPSSGSNTRGGITIVVALVICAQGYIQLFFGYVENYAFYTLATALYLCLSIRFVRGRGPLLLPATALFVAISLHIAAVILLPSFIVLFVWALTKSDKRAGAIRDLIVFVVLLGALHIAIAGWQPGYSLFDTLLDATGVAVTREHERVSMFSPVHLRDFLNEQLLIGPLGVFIFAAGLVAWAAARKAVTIARAFLLTAALGYLGAAWLAGDSNLGYARDWDVWAPAGLVFTTAGLGLFVSLGAPSRGALACALFVSLYHTAPWIAVNASAHRGLARLKTLPLGLGRTEVLVSQWYRDHGQDEERRLWLERSIAVNPANNNAHYLLGVYHSERGEPEAAAESFARAVALRPDKLLFRQQLIAELIRAGRREDALPHLEFLLQRSPDDLSHWMLYGETLRQTGHDEQAVAVFERALAMYAPLLAEDPGHYESNLASGWLLYNLDRYDESLPYLERAAAAKPDADAAHCLLGYALSQMGRPKDAARHFEKCLALNPDRSDRADIERLLIGADQHQ